MEPNEDNRRQTARTPITTAAYLSPHRVLITRSGDVSASGAFLTTRFPDPVGTRATLEVDDPTGARVRLDVEVVRVSFDARAPGMGVTFVDMSPALERRVAAQLAATEPPRICDG